MATTTDKQLLQEIDEKELLNVLLSVNKGDFSTRMSLDYTGRAGRIADTLNAIIEQNERQVRELQRISKVVGKQGKISERASIQAEGDWNTSIDAVNALITDLAQPITEVARVIGSVAKGDLSQTMDLELDGRPIRGEFLKTGKIVNRMVDQLSSFASEVTRVAREVGTEGKLGGQAQVKGVSGTWKDLTDNVNSMADNLTTQVRNIAEVTTAVATGDLSKKITVEAAGEVADLKNTINTMVDQLSSFASEVTRVAREVGTEGKLGGQAQVKGVSGTWKDLTDNVNSMADNLTTQVRNIAEVTTAVATGDLSKKITVDVKGEILELKDTINTMVDQLSSFASEVTRVAREVGTEGKLGGQARVKGVSGTWKDLTDNVNSMAGNLTTQVRNIAEVTTAVANGDLSKKITVDVAGEIQELKDTINTMVDQLSSFASEVTRVAREVGTEGKLGGQARVKGVSGTWKDLTDNVNSMADNLTTQVRNIAEVTTAVATGDLSKKITVDVKGEILELKNTINTMVDQLSSFASEVTRVAREVGTEGKLGGQANVPGVSGTWEDLTDNVNSMANNLTTQVRGIAEVTTAVANGDLSKKITVDVNGEIQELKNTINTMVDTLATFGDQVTTVAREVGIEGKLGGQANVPGASGTWKDLTDNVNRLAANLTTQVRAITEVTTAVADGDLSKKITVEAAGEVADLKDNVNEMIRNLKDTTRKNTEQDWLKTNLTTFTRLLQGQKDLMAVSRLILSEMAPLVEAQHGAFYITHQSEEAAEPVYKLLASYAYRERKGLANQFQLGEGLVGQCALERERIVITNVPGDYIQINSGLGEAPPYNIVVMPVLFEGEVKAIIELASFHKFSPIHMAFLDQLAESIGIVLNTIQANMRTEKLLAQSQSLTQELQSQQEELTETNQRLEQQAQSLQASEELLKRQQEELQQTNTELEDKAALLAEQKSEVERKNREIETARLAIEEKAEQLALTSKYKSEFLANMSHELRTPLNSMLILSKMLAENKEGTLSNKQVEFARTVHSAGSDLLTLINEILDLSKIESGTMTAEIEEVDLETVRHDLERTFRQIAEEKDLSFRVQLAPSLPDVVHTDEKRLLQVLRNLLSNAFKFTREGKISLNIKLASDDEVYENELLNRASRVISFTVTDTGIGIPSHKQRVIFEAFQQADGTTSRDYGGTGLGLSISREIVRLLGGEIRLESAPGEGSTFTVFLPEKYIPTSLAAPAPEAPDQTATSTETSNGVSDSKKSLESTFDADEVAEAVASAEVPTVPDNSGDGATKPAAVQSASNGATTEDVEVEENLDLRPRKLSDDRDDLEPEDRVLLIVEDDTNFARVLVDIAHDKGLKAIVASSGEDALEMAQQYNPDAITLDVQLPGMHGLSLLDQLKNNTHTRHIPVNIISIAEKLPRRQKRGALKQIKKPVTRDTVVEALSSMEGFLDRKTKNLLVVEDDNAQRMSIVELIRGDDVQMTAVGTGAEVLTALETGHFDCVVMDLGLPDMSGFELIEQIREELKLQDLPIIIYTARDLTKEEAAELHQRADAVIIKDMESFDRLLDETALFLHRSEAKLPDDRRDRIEQLHKPETSLAGRKILIVDDDVRNIFAITSLLERHNMEVLYADNGRDGIEMLMKNPDIDGVLMDIMMPGMNGYEATRAIRKISRFNKLPIIAVTAKAMKGDREKCIEAGASDYITKPVNVDQLLSLLRVWMQA